MTPTDNDMTIIRPLAAMSLVVRDPSGKTRRVPLASGQMVVGRGEESALVLESGDPAASRRHAVISVDGPVVTVEDAGSTNGVFVNGNRVERAMLRPGDVVRLGRTELAVVASAAVIAPPAPEQAQSVDATRPGRRPPVRVFLYLAVLCAVGAALWMAVSSSDRAPDPKPQAGSPPASSAAGKASGPTSGPTPGTLPTPPTPAPESPAPAATPAAAPEAVEKSQEHARQAAFFYNSGKIGLAVGEWEKAVALDPGNSQAAKWLARAEGELDQLLDKHYREGLTALKYSRRDEAMENFRFVVEHCREQADERRLDALRQLGQLEGKKP
jgi:pSer/pThr/pTyr-binding forkhead associated (FHA) protein